MRLRTVILLSFILIYSLASANYIPREDKQKQCNNYKIEIEKYESSINIDTKIISTLNLRLKDVINQIKVLSDLMSDMKSGTSPNKTIQQEVEFIKRKESIERLKSEFKKRIVTLYKKGVDYQYQILFTSESPSKFYARLEYLTKLSQSRKIDFEKIKYEEYAFLESKKISGLNKNELGKYMNLKKQDQTSLINDKSMIEDSLSLLRSNIENYNYQIEKIRSRIIDLEYYLTNNTENTFYLLKSTPNYASDNFELLKGKLIIPVNSTDIVNDFGKSINPFTGTVTFNDGVDVSISENSEVRCVADGVVENIYDIPLYKKVIIVSHNNGYRTIYGIVKTVNVYQGNPVKAGDIIAYTSQNLDGQLFHFEVRRGIIPEDPKYWVARNQ
jgi:murein DD-endopeptidase MepM/ murein hydrolase activator NlpD